MYYELRVLFSTFLFIYWFYLIRGIDNILRIYFIDLFQRKSDLPVTVENVRWDVELGVLHIENIKVHSPPIDIDPRWHSPVIASITRLSVTFRFWRVLYAYVVTDGLLFSFETIKLEGIKMNIEGFDEADGKVYVNLKLVGRNSTFVRLRKPTQRDIKELEKEKKKAFKKKVKPNAESDMNHSSNKLPENTDALQATLDTQAPEVCHRNVRIVPVLLYQIVPTAQGSSNHLHSQSKGGSITSYEFVLFRQTRNVMAALTIYITKI